MDERRKIMASQVNEYLANISDEERLEDLRKLD
jgi:hypothetical protein